MKTNFSLIILLYFLFSIHPLFAQQTGTTTGISGKLHDEKEKPVYAAKVSLISVPDSAVTALTVSSDSGSYTFKNIKPGDYILKVNSLGHPLFTSPTFHLGDKPQVDIPMIHLESNSQQLKGINIVATQPSIQQKEGKTIVNIANSVLAAGNNVLEILERAPGVSIDKDQNISFRGRTGVLVMINDKPTYLSGGQLTDMLQGINGSNIKSIELIPNPGAKYDASGSAGIINIVLKKNDQYGTNGSVTAGIAQGKYYRDDLGLNLNNKQGPLNVFGSFNHGYSHTANAVQLNHQSTDQDGKTTFVKQGARRTYDNYKNSYRFGADYEMSKKNTIGFVMSGYHNTTSSDEFNTSKLNSDGSILDSVLSTHNKANERYNNIAANIYDKLKLDTSGQELTIDLDYSKFKTKITDHYQNLFSLPDGSTQHPDEFLNIDKFTNIQIKTAKVDYKLPFNKTTMLEAGFKHAYVKTDNDLEAEILQGGTFTNDISRTNHFIYTEQVDAGYINFKSAYKKTTFTAGLRSEYTSSNGNLIGSSQIKRHYINFFPSVSIDHAINQKNTIGVVINRSLERPNYGNLNPFIYYLDPLSFMQGNPFLNPEYTYNYAFNYTYNEKIQVGLSYSRTKDNISDAIFVEGNKTFSTPRNFRLVENYNLHFYSPYTLSSWWHGDFDFNGFYARTEADNIGGINLRKGKVAFQAKSTQTFTFEGFKGELSGFYNSSTISGSYNAAPYYSVDAGVSRSFMNKKANLKLVVSDIFNTRRTYIEDRILSNFSFRSKSETRMARLNFTYNFGNTKIKAKTHRGGAADETSRAGG